MRPQSDTLRWLRRHPLRSSAVEFEVGSADDQGHLTLGVVLLAGLGEPAEIKTTSGSGSRAKLTIDLREVPEQFGRLVCFAVGAASSARFTATDPQAEQDLVVRAITGNVIVLAECRRDVGGWWVREVGHGVADLTTLADRLGIGGRVRGELTGLRSPPSSVRQAKIVNPRSLGGSLATARLVGQRATTGPVGLDVAVDLSPSMSYFSEQRLAALRALTEFARKQLTDEDLITVVAFAACAAVMTRPTPVRELAGGSDRPDGPVGEGTLLVPAVRLLKSLRKEARTGRLPRSLLVITDAELFDDGNDIALRLHQGSYDHIFFAVPSEASNLSNVEGEGWFTQVKVRHFRDADSLGLLYGEVFATMTGQELSSPSGTS